MKWETSNEIGEFKSSIDCSSTSISLLFAFLRHILPTIDFNFSLTVFQTFSDHAS